MDNEPIFHNKPPMEEPDPAQTNRDRWLGIGIFFGLNLVVFPIIGFLLSLLVFYAIDQFPDFGQMFDTLNLCFTFLPFVFNIGLIIYFAFKRPQVAIGILIGFAIALGIVIVLGICFLTACFVMLFSYGSSF